MPRANDALNGEMKTLDPRWAELILVQSANEKLFADSVTLLSAVVRSRGNAVRRDSEASTGDPHSFNVNAVTASELAGDPDGASTISVPLKGPRNCSSRKSLATKSAT